MAQPSTRIDRNPVIFFHLIVAFTPEPGPGLTLIASIGLHPQRVGAQDEAA
jgi:hypothetical protein